MSNTSTQRKSLPINPSLDVQRKLLFEPESNPTGYVPFEHAAAHPFEPSPGGHSRVNAWWLAEAAWLAYSHDDDAVRTVLKERAGLTAFAPLDAGATHGFVASCDTFAIVAFRGTQSGDWGDLFDDVRFLPVTWDVGHVHQGFASAFLVISAQLEAALAALPASLPVWFTGHSLGAAVATLAAWRHRARPGGICTIGSPLVGNGVFAGEFDTALEPHSLRFVNDHDVVTRVPPPPFALLHGRYTHVSTLRTINSDGHIGSTPPTLPHFVRDVFGDTGVLLDMVTLSHASSGLRLPAALADHTPLYYVIHCWNDLVSQAP
jgi:pimeloyl-ACP methyl ester carboxylesterase